MSNKAEPKIVSESKVMTDSVTERLREALHAWVGAMGLTDDGRRIRLDADDADIAYVLLAARGLRVVDIGEPSDLTRSPGCVERPARLMGDVPTREDGRTDGSPVSEQHKANAFALCKPDANINLREQLARYLESIMESPASGAPARCGDRILALVEAALLSDKAVEAALTAWFDNEGVAIGKPGQTGVAIHAALVASVASVT